MTHCTIETYLGPAGLTVAFDCPPAYCDWHKTSPGKRCLYYNRRLGQCQCQESQLLARQTLCSTVQMEIRKNRFVDRV